MNHAAQAIQQAYDDVPYRSRAVPHTSPDRLAAIARLYGVTAVDPDRARVLELGCAEGGNLVAMAVWNPGASFTGIDLSPVQIDAGRKLAHAIGLENLQLHAADLSAFEGEGRYDYIICHGVYSWVPAEVRESILALCARLLSDDGIAFLSYNTYPGWKFKDVARDAMRFWGDGHDAPADRVGHGRAMVDFMAKAAPEGSLVKRVAESHAREFAQANQEYLFHEYLEADNSAFYFRDVMDDAARHGLAFLSDAHLATMFAPPGVSTDTVQAVARESKGDAVVREQLMDFITGRTFRDTLLVRAGREPANRYALEAKGLERLQFAGAFKCLEDVRFDDSRQPYEVADGRGFTLATRVVKAGLAVIADASPGSVDLVQLRAGVARLLGGVPPQLEQGLGELLRFLVGSGLVHFRVTPLVGLHGGDRPRIGAKVRSWVAAMGATAGSAIAGSQHQRIELDPLATWLIPLADGSRSRAELADALVKAVSAGVLVLQRDGARLASLGAQQARDMVDAMVDFLAGQGLLSSAGE